MRRGCVQIVGGEQNRHPLLVEVGEQMQNVFRGLHIHACCWFIQHKHVRFSHEGASQEDTLLLPAGEVADVARAQSANA